MHAICRPLTTLAATSLVMALAGCGSAPTADNGNKQVGGKHYPVTISTCGFTATVPARPQRAVTVSQGATEVALALGVSAQIRGTSYLDDEIPAQWKAEYDAIPKVWKQYPSQEELLGEKPDFVYAAYASAYDKEALGSPKDLEKFGIPSMTSLFGCGDGDAKPVHGVTFDSVWEEIDLVAKVFDADGHADKIRAEQQATLKTLAEQKAGAGVRVFWYDSGDKTPYVGTGEGGPQLVLDAVGATNVFAEISHGWTDIAWEKVVATDPDVIVVPDASWSTAQAKIDYLKKDPVLSQLRAVKADAFISVPFSETTPGVRLVDGAVHVAEQLAKLPAARTDKTTIGSGQS